MIVQRLTGLTGLLKRQTGARSMMTNADFRHLHEQFGTITGVNLFITTMATTFLVMSYHFLRCKQEAMHALVQMIRADMAYEDCPRQTAEASRLIGAEIKIAQAKKSRSGLMESVDEILDKFAGGYL